MSKKTKIAIILIVLLAVIIGVVYYLGYKYGSKAPRHMKNRSNIEFSVNLPDNDFSDIIYVYCMDVEDSRNTFSMTFCKTNNYKISASVESSNYVITEYSFGKSKGYGLDIQQFNVSKPGDYKIQCNVLLR